MIQCKQCAFSTAPNMISHMLIKCVFVTVAAAAIVTFPEYEQDPKIEGKLESLLMKAQDVMQSLWRRARSEADTVMQGVVHNFRRQEHDALQAATVQLEQLGVNVDLNEAGDDVGDDLYGCAKSTQAKYVGLLTQLRRRVQRCWGWETREVRALVRAVEDLILAGDRLPALLRTNMDVCINKGRKKTVSAGGWERPRKPRGGAGVDNTTVTSVTSETTTSSAPPPSPFRLLRCTADSVNLTWTYVSSVPREVGRAARKTASLLGSSREDWAGCARGVVRQTAGSAVTVLRDLGTCVADRVSEQSWQKMHDAWQDPR